MSTRRVLLWNYEIEPSLIEELVAQGVDVVATVDGAVARLPHYSLQTLHAASVALPRSSSAGYPRLGPELFRVYSRCVSRIGSTPGNGRLEVHVGGALDLTEIEHLGALQLHQAVDLLRHHAIEEVWFFSVPHLGVDLLMDAAAKHLGLRVLVLRQLAVPLKFQFRVWQGFRELDLPELQFETTDMTLEPSLFYMQPRQWDDFLSATRRRLGHLLAGLRSGRPGTLLAQAWRAARDRRWWRTAEWLEAADRRTRHQAFMHAHLRRQHRIGCAERKMAEADGLSQPFVYFALHYEPEANADIYGGELPTQVDAIEQLADRLPAGWLLVLKENPKQTSFRRSSAFYARLRRLPNTFWANDATSTRELLEKCRLPATLCGTVGWEAIRAGRSCLYFGEPWYVGLPGAVAWHPDLDLAAVASQRVSAESLQAAANELFRRAANGVVAARFLPLLPAGVSRSDAGRMTARSLQAICAAADLVAGENG